MSTTKKTKNTTNLVYDWTLLHKHGQNDDKWQCKR